jgi:hypothetical protein
VGSKLHVFLAKSTVILMARAVMQYREAEADTDRCAIDLILGLYVINYWPEYIFHFLKNEK